MVYNKFLKCRYCGEIFNIRTQVGFTNMPINIYCPHCGSHISGHLFVDNENIKFSQEFNADISEEIEPPFYRIELSQEFMVFKFLKCEKPEDLYLPTPFLRNFGFINRFKENQNQIIRINNFSINSSKNADILENLFSLLEARKFDLISHFIKNSEFALSKYFSEYCNINELKTLLDYTILVKQYSNSLISPSMKENTFNIILDEVKILNLFKTKRKESIYFLKYLNKNDILENYFISRIPRYISEYIRKFPQLLPVFFKKRFNETVDFDIYGITTANVADLLDLYSNGYELFSDAIDLVIGIDNIMKRGEYDCFIGGRNCFSEKLKSYKSKFNKISYFCGSDDFPICKFLNPQLSNRIRNPIAHYSWKIDGITQTIFLEDKIKASIETIFISELAEKCIDLYEKLLLVWEYYYQFYKSSLLVFDKLNLNYRFSSDENYKV